GGLQDLLSGLRSEVGRDDVVVILAGIAGPIVRRGARQIEGLTGVDVVQDVACAVVVGFFQIAERPIEFRAENLVGIVLTTSAVRVNLDENPVGSALHVNVRAHPRVDACGRHGDGGVNLSILYLQELRSRGADEVEGGEEKQRALEDHKVALGLTAGPERNALSVGLRTIIVGRHINVVDRWGLRWPPDAGERKIAKTAEVTQDRNL